MSKREYWIDALRGLACLIVLNNHFFLAYLYGNGSLNKKYPYLSFTYAGSWAVCIFLIISSYVISNQFFSADPLNEKKIASTLFKRYFRLALPIFLSSSFAFFLYKTGLLYSAKELAKYTNSHWLKNTYIYCKPLTLRELFTSSFIDVWYSGNSTFNAPFWMMGILFKGFFLAILLALLVRKNRKGYILLIVLCFVFFLNKSQYLCIVLGVLWSHSKNYTSFMQATQNKWHECILGLISIYSVISIGFVPKYIAFAKHIISDTYLSDRIFWYTLFASLLILSIAKSSFCIKIIEQSRLLKYLGKISFGIYLFHWPVICSLIAKLYVLLYKHSFIASHYYRSLGFIYIILVIITCALSTVYTILFEAKLFKKIITTITNTYMSHWENQDPHN